MSIIPFQSFFRIFTATFSFKIASGLLSPKKGEEMIVENIDG